jgi:hypothetical protein
VLAEAVTKGLIESLALSVKMAIGHQSIHAFDVVFGAGGTIQASAQGGDRQAGAGD